MNTNQKLGEQSRKTQNTWGPSQRNRFKSTRARKRQRHKVKSKTPVSRVGKWYFRLWCLHVHHFRMWQQHGHQEAFCHSEQHADSYFQCLRKRKGRAKRDPKPNVYFCPSCFSIIWSLSRNLCSKIFSDITRLNSQELQKKTQIPILGE